MLVGVLVSRKDLKEPHTDAMWDSRKSGGVLVSRKDLKDCKKNLGIAALLVCVIERSLWMVLTSPQRNKPPM